MKRNNSLDSLSLSFVPKKEEEEENTEGSDDETKNTLDKYEKIGLLKESPEIKESICTKHYDKEGNKYYNEYKFISFLGSGSFSKIELVEKDGVKYALKIIDKVFLHSQKKIEVDEEGNIIMNSSFENAIKEIAILKKTNHPNIIKLYEILYSKDNKKIYLILEYCEHGDLIDYDDKTGEFKLNQFFMKKEKNDKENNKLYYSNEEICKFLKDIISGLYYLHSNGIIHRDIKPNNILLDKNNTCKITDFNVSSILENLDDDNIGRKICSADHFRPPEGCDMSNLDDDDDDNNETKKKKPDLKGKPIDIWALGITTYILSYNKFPFESENDNIFELYDKIFKAKFEFPEFPKRNDVLKQFIKKCLEKDPDKRIRVEDLLKFPFCEKNYIENVLKHSTKINVTKNDKIESFNFFLPNCSVISEKFGHFKTKLSCKYRKFKGKIDFREKIFYFRKIKDIILCPIEKLKSKFKKEDIPEELDEDKSWKRIIFKNHKKYKLKDEKQKDEPKKKKIKMFNINFISKSKSD